MAPFFRTSRVWVVEFLYDGHPRRWLKALPADADADAGARMAAELQDLHGRRARLLAVRPASADEEAQYLRGESSVNPMCPTGRAPPRAGG